MNTSLLIFFAIPVAVIVFSIVLQKLLKCPILIASLVFAIFLIVAVVLNNLNVFVLAVAYAILAYLSAIISCLLCNLIRNNPAFAECSNCCGNNYNGNNNDFNNSITTVNGMIEIEDTLDDNNRCTLNTANASENTNSISRCNCSNNNSNTIIAEANIIPNRNNNGRTGAIRGCYRRR